MNRNPKKNKEGYDDPTAYHGTKPLVDRDNQIEKAHRQLINSVLTLAGWRAFRLKAVSCCDTEKQAVFSNKEEYRYDWY